MTSFVYQPAATHLVRLPFESDLYDEITAYARDHDIRAASVTCLGAVRRASLRYYDQDGRDYRDFSLERHLEVVASVGNISLLDGEPFLHLHMALADEDGRAFGGHVNQGTTVFALEVTIFELDGEPPERAHDSCTGLTLWGGTVEDC